MPTPDPLAELVAPFHEQPDRAGVFTDFDGTLAAIVDDPDAARPLPTAVQALSRLADRYARVGVISGRSVDALAERLGPALVDRLVLSGLYGLEVIDRGDRREDERAEEWRARVAASAGRAGGELPAAVLVERKNLSLTLHFRTAPEHEAAVAEWADREGERSGLLARRARMSVELHPPVETDKGTALVTAAEGLRAVCFLGDDVGDLPAFAALDALAAEGMHTLKVGVRSEEAPRDLERAVHLLVDGPEGAVALLERLAQPAAES